MIGCHNIGILFHCTPIGVDSIESEEHKMRKKYLIEENKKLKDEVEDLKRQLTYAKTQIDIKDICLMLNKEREVCHD